jgi:hypothetical protein
VVAQETTTLTEAELECAFSNLMGCLADLVRIVFGIFWWFTSIAGKFLDFFINYSTSSLTYAQGSDFVHRGWALVRDISNIFFIFVLLYIAIGTILNLSQVDTKKMLTKVIIIALLINFSLFFTKIVIDASNILARAFIGSMQINVTDVNGNPIESNVQQFSVAIVAKFNPNQLLDDKEGSPYYEFKKESPNTASTLRLVMLLAGIAILAVMVWTFFKVGLFFLARVITLWLVMITAPIAFISIVLPFNIPKLGHQEWTKNLFSAAFMAPIFLFFMYLIIVFLDMGFFDNLALNSSQGFGDMMLRIIIPFIIIMMLVLQAAKISEKMSGEIGSVVAKVGGAALGLAAVGVTGIGAGIARAGAGVAGSAMSGSKMGGRLGRGIRSMGSTLETGSMDWRNTKGGQAIMKNMGMDTMGIGSWGSKAGEGGAKGAKERYEKARQEDAKRYTDNNTSAERKDLEAIEDRMTEFNDIFAETIKDLEDKVVDARTALKDHAVNEPQKPTVPRNAKNKAVWDTYDTDKTKHDEDKATLTENMGKAQTNLSNVTDVKQPGFDESYSEMKTKARTAKQTVATASTAARTEYAEAVKDEWLTFRTEKTRQNLGKKIRFNRQSNKAS